MLAATDFVMTNTGKDFVWFGETRPGLPLIRLLDGTIHRPYLFYFGFVDRIKRHRVSRKSRKKQAYSLRYWLLHCTQIGISWLDGSDYHLSAWRETMRKTGLSTNQMERRIACVFDFYMDIHKAMPLLADGSACPEFVASPVAALGDAPITSKLIRHDGHDILVWSGADPRQKSIEQPTAPSQDQVIRILTALRSPKPGVEESEDAVHKRERDWLMASTMAWGGYRAIEVTRIGVSHLTMALRREGILDGLALTYGKYGCVSEFADNKEAQEEILQRIKDFVVKRKRKYIYVLTCGKKDKLRDAPFTPELIIDILTVGVWTVRAAIIRRRTSEDPTYSPPDCLFISPKTGDAYVEGSVSDIVKEAFIAADVYGSGHDLRRFYATYMATIILEEHIWRMNGQVTEAVINTVFHRVADALGHSQVTTTVKHYVDMALIHWTGVRNKTRRAAIMAAWETMVENQENLSQAKIQVIGNLTKGLAAVSEDSDLFKLLDRASRDPDLNPAGPMEVRRKENHLRPVKDPS